MCGIVGYIGSAQAAPILLEGLKRLEYRGYDSAGVAVLKDAALHVRRCVGKLSRLEVALNKSPLSGTMGIGHTRWATHGRPSDSNAHPHTDCHERFAIVHNGIIENYLPIKESLEKKGHRFLSETDTEVLAHLFEEYYNGNLEETVARALLEVRGSYAIGAISCQEPGKIVAARKESPLVIGIGKDENFLASDIPAFLSHTRSALIMEDGEIAILTPGDVDLRTLDGKRVERSSFEVLWDEKMAEKSGYRHFMLKEIFEQPRVVLDTLKGRLMEDGQITLEETNLTPSVLDRIKKIYVIACGTAYHAGMIGKYVIEELVRLPVEVDLASELRYRHPLVDEDTLFIAISQSGETADTLAAVREARKLGARTLAITNVVGSSITREVDGVLYIRAGLEIGVAATKTFTAQVIALNLLAMYMAAHKGLLGSAELKRIASQLFQIPALMEQVLSSADTLQRIARKYHKCSDFLFLGRQISYPIALEGALKLKEISYIHAEGYAAGEMKHGPIALVDHNLPVIAITMQNRVYEKMLANIKEVKARDAVVIGIASAGDEDIAKYLDHVVYVPRTDPILSPVLSIITLQLLAYYTACRRGCDVDKPRNLAKSVTVE